jgi:hypothetical protein
MDDGVVETSFLVDSSFCVFVFREEEVATDGNMREAREESEDGEENPLFLASVCATIVGFVSSAFVFAFFDVGDCNVFGMEEEIWPRDERELEDRDDERWS